VKRYITQHCATAKHCSALLRTLYLQYTQHFTTTTTHTALHYATHTALQYWGDQFMSALRDLLEEACKRGGVADCEFFINKRDYPHLKYNEHTKEPVEPYGFIFDKDDRNPDEDVVSNGKLPLLELATALKLQIS
jgi:hypothetical protein